MKRKILSVFMVLVLAIGCVFSLTACGNANEKYNEFVNAAAKDYYSTHRDYKNFDDISVEFTANAEETYESEAEGKFDSEKSETTTKVAIKKVAEEYVVMVEVDATVTEVEWELKEGSETEYEEVTTTTVTTTKTVTGSKLENQIATFYAIQETSMKVNDEEPIEAKIYNMTTEEAYERALESAMRSVNNGMKMFFYSGTKSALNDLADQGAEIELKVKKEEATLKAVVNDFEISGQYAEGSQESTVEFAANKPSKYTMSMSMADTFGNVEAMDMSLAVSYSAEVPTIDGFDGYVIGFINWNYLVPSLGMGY
jgi:uncharacterized lipoprotein YehR (DUF1307 family)